MGGNVLLTTGVSILDFNMDERNDLLTKNQNDTCSIGTKIILSGDFIGFVDHAIEENCAKCSQVLACANIVTSSSWGNK